ncbi:hypothetical protein [Thermus thermophilus]|nr:hypothetical protein [Thermus thermophilus]
MRGYAALASLKALIFPQVRLRRPLLEGGSRRATWRRPWATSFRVFSPPP